MNGLRMGRILGLCALLFALDACSGVGSGLLGGGDGSFPAYDPGTQVQLANPTPGQTDVGTNLGPVTIVANGNSDTLFNTYGSGA